MSAQEKGERTLTCVLKFCHVVRTTDSSYTMAQAQMEEKMRELADQPNTTVLKTEYDILHEPWKSDRLRAVLEKIVKRVMESDENADAFRLRKQMMSDDNEILQFQRDHPQMYWAVTDRQLMSQEKYRNAVTAMLRVKEKVERGEVPANHEADGMATSAIVQALGATVPS